MDASANPRITPDLQAIVPNLHWRYTGVTATNRASFYLYTVEDEIDRLVAGLRVAKEKLG